MEDFVQWCLICEKKLTHDGMYCSMNCLRTDFGIISPTVPSKNQHRDHLGWIQSQTSLRTSQPTKRLSSSYIPHLPATVLESLPSSEDVCPPSPSLSVTSASSRRSSIKSNDSNGSISSYYEISHSILAPTVSLEFKSRPRRRL
ncbi:hypothetical protein HDU79_011113 [Rhizoclosmatium sp. JEL0117]|nr:hypothetical protein HDU79_011113 [Rhizoclosmatium sp. JEL0117]